MPTLVTARGATSSVCGFGLAIAALLTPFVAAAQVTASPLTTAERAVTRAVDSHNADALALLERIVNINSGT